ncbi:uncharacterized protein [Dysidea avara]|uniref:uncharacterized protein n=1 Tax=Dysidea avara TaxID=196820 RepID=UPI00332A706D
METMLLVGSLVLLSFISRAADAVLVRSSNDSISEGNCTGPLDYFLCNCLTTNTTIDIQVSPDQYTFRRQSDCILENKTSIRIIGNSSNDTVFNCTCDRPFGIVFLRVCNVTIEGIQMVGCGDVVSNIINQTLYTIVPAIHFGAGFRSAVMFYYAKDVRVTDLILLNTLGYGIVTVDTIGNVTLSTVRIINTTFDNDPACDNYDFSIDTATFYCSGSGILIVYHDNIEVGTVDEANTVLTIDQSVFLNNRNLIPDKQLAILIELTATGFYQLPVPLQGASGISIYYLQKLYDVKTEISNSLFYNNYGSLAGSSIVTSVSSIRGTTFFEKCHFEYEETALDFAVNSGYLTRGGISFFHLMTRNAPGIEPLVVTTEIEVILGVLQCDFTNLGGRLGAALHFDRISSDTVSLVIVVELCNFIGNVADAGAAVYAIDNGFTSSGGLSVFLININAHHNAISPSSSLLHASSEYITGVFSAKISLFILNCSEHCSFTNNEPSVFYGHSSSIEVSGSVEFLYNVGNHGGAFDVINTIVYFYQGAHVYFGHNYAMVHGGALDIISFTINLVTCPIQFLGPNTTDPILTLDRIGDLNLNITFENNTAGSSGILQSIYANVFYVCFYYPYTITQLNFGLETPVVNGTRSSVYRNVFKFVPEGSASEHLFVSAYLPCPCYDNGTYESGKCLAAEANNTLKLDSPVIAGRSFTISLVTLDVVGSIGFTQTLYSDVYYNETSGGHLALDSDQNERPFSIVNRQCTPVDFTIYGLQTTLPKYGNLRLSVIPGSNHDFNFTFDDCPTGFSIQKYENGLYGCACGEFFMESEIRDDFQCNPVSGMIRRLDLRSWLATNDDRIEYTSLCIPTYCDDSLANFTLEDQNILCINSHAGRVCGGCVDNLSKVFGSNICKKCSNIWLATIILYALLGIILVLILFFLRFTVTLGAINGLIFFCNAVSINEHLFFNTERSDFLFLRVFISLLNLDLGFEVCFYDKMTQIGKTGLQFVFPIYLWLLISIIVYLGRYYFRSRRVTSSSVLPVLATLILLSYSKLLRTTISAFSSTTIYYSSADSNYTDLQKISVWYPDPNVEFLHGTHVILFLIGIVFILVFILPLALAMTFPTVVLRSKRLSYFFPLFDCFYAPFKGKYRYWFGARMIVLIYLSTMESIIRSYQEALLLSVVIAVLAFAIVQAYIRPFKNTIINILDLIFMGIFILLSVITLYIYPSSSGYAEVNIAVNVLGSVAFVLFCFVLVFHVYNIIKKTARYLHTIKTLQEMLRSKGISANFDVLFTSKPIDRNTTNMSRYGGSQEHSNDDYYAHLQESLLEQI